MSLRRLLFLLLLLCALVPAARAQETVLVAAAADLKFALDEVAEAFRAESGKTLQITYGSSGNLAAQIENGAPFQLFLCADEAYVTRLAAAGFARDAGVLYGVGRLALFVPSGSPVRADPELRDLRAALADGRLSRLAIANPDHAPYGRAAREVLQSQGLWDRAAGHLVLGENAAQAAQFATSGGAQAGLIALALAQSPRLRERGSFVLLTDRWHQPLRQRMVLTRLAGATAQSFYQYMQSPAARAILARHGFALPEPH